MLDFPYTRNKKVNAVFFQNLVLFKFKLQTSGVKSKIVHKVSKSPYASVHATFIASLISASTPDWSILLWWKFHRSPLSPRATPLHESSLLMLNILWVITVWLQLNFRVHNGGLHYSEIPVISIFIFLFSSILKLLVTDLFTLWVCIFQNITCLDSYNK